MHSRSRNKSEGPPTCGPHEVRFQGTGVMGESVPMRGSPSTDQDPWEPLRHSLVIHDFSLIHEEKSMFIVKLRCNFLLTISFSNECMVEFSGSYLVCDDIPALTMICLFLYLKHFLVLISNMVNVYRNKTYKLKIFEIHYNFWEDNGVLRTTRLHLNHWLRWGLDAFVSNNDPVGTYVSGH